MAEIQLLREATIEPTSDMIAMCLGDTNAVYLKFVKELGKQDVEVEWRYYNDGKAWLGKALYKWTTARGTKKEMTTFWLSIWEGFFKVRVFVSEKARADALSLQVSKETREKIEKAEQMGKLKFFPVIFDCRSEESLDDIYTLIDFKKAIK